MYEINHQVSVEHLQDLQREAANERLANEVRKPNAIVRKARQSLGRGLVNVGHSLLGE